MNPFTNYIQTVLDAARAAQGAFVNLQHMPPVICSAGNRSLPVTLNVAAHPDDESMSLLAIILRLLGARVINYAATFGSKVGERVRRLKELQAACGYLQFELAFHSGDVLVEQGVTMKPELIINPSIFGLSSVNLAAEASAPDTWQANVKRMHEALMRYRPGCIIVHHDNDFNSTHIGLNRLVEHALRMCSGYTPVVIMTEYWHAMTQPNVMLEISREVAAIATAAISCHAVEVARNPGYNVSFVADLMHHARRCPEVIFGAGGQGGQVELAAPIRVMRWVDGDNPHLEPCTSKMFIKANDANALRNMFDMS